MINFYNKNLLLGIFVFIIIIVFLLIKLTNPTKKQYHFSYKKNAEWLVFKTFSNKLILLKDNKKYLFYCKKKCLSYNKNDILQFTALVFPLNQPLAENDYNISYAYPNVIAKVALKKNSKIKVKPANPSFLAKIKKKNN